MRLPAPVVAVGAFVFDRRGRLLMVQRAREPAAGLWSVPGGRVLAGESLRTACVREVREETGIDVRCGPLAAWFEARGPSHHYVVLDFLARPRVAAPQRVCAGDDAAQAGWVTPAGFGTLAVTPRLRHYVRRAWRQAQATGFFDASPGTSRTRRGTR